MASEKNSATSVDSIELSLERNSFDSEAPEALSTISEINEPSTANSPEETRETASRTENQDEKQVPESPATSTSAPQTSSTLAAPPATEQVVTVNRDSLTPPKSGSSLDKRVEEFRRTVLEEYSDPPSGASSYHSSSSSDSDSGPEDVVVPESLPREEYSKTLKEAKTNGKAVRLQGMLIPSAVVNSKIRCMQHELLVLLQRNASIHRMASFGRSEPGRKISHLVEKLFGPKSKYAYAASQLLTGSKDSLQCHLQRMRDSDPKREFQSVTIKPYFNHGHLGRPLKVIRDPPYFSDSRPQAEILPGPSTNTATAQFRRFPEPPVSFQARAPVPGTVSSSQLRAPAPLVAPAPVRATRPSWTPTRFAPFPPRNATFHGGQRLPGQQRFQKKKKLMRDRY